MRTTASFNSKNVYEHSAAGPSSGRTGLTPSSDDQIKKDAKNITFGNNFKNK